MSINEIEAVALYLASEIDKERVVCSVIGSNIKKDKYSRKLLVLELYCKNVGKVLSVYSPVKAKILLEALKKLDIQNMIGKCFEFNKQAIQLMRENYSQPYPILIPVKEVKCDDVY